jgi:serine/threonine protein kinase
MLVFGRAKPMQRGAESTVFPAAVKIKNDPGDAHREYTIQRMCASAYVVPVEYLELSRAIVMPAATMDLFAFLESKETIEPGELWGIVRHMSAAVAAVHRNSVVHRDVKLENFLCFDEPCGDWDDESGNDGGESDEEKEKEEKEEEKEKEKEKEGAEEEGAEKKEKEEEAAPLVPLAVKTVRSTRMVVKLTDFGFATKLEEGSKLSASEGARVGSVQYVAPEIVDFAQYDAKADVWSLGVCVFMMLTKCAPFGVSCCVSRYETFAPRAQKRWSERSKDLTEPQRGLVARSLTVDQDKRASSRAISRAAARCT